MGAVVVCGWCDCSGSISRVHTPARHATDTPEKIEADREHTHTILNQERGGDRDGLQPVEIESDN